MRVNSLPETVTRQRRGCDLNPGRTAPESSTLTTRLQSHQLAYLSGCTTIPYMYSVAYRNLRRVQPPAVVGVQVNPRDVIGRELWLSDVIRRD